MLLRRSNLIKLLLMPIYGTGGKRSITKNWCPDIYEHFRNVLLHSSTITVPCARYQLTSGICEIILAIITTATTNYHNYQNHSQLSQLLEIEAIQQIARALILATLEPLEMRPGSELQYRHNIHAKFKVQFYMSCYSWFSRDPIFCF